MNYQSSNFGSEGSWNENVKKGLKVEISLNPNLGGVGVILPTPPLPVGFPLITQKRQKL